MKNLCLAIIMVFITSCKKDTNKSQINYKTETLDVTTSIYPEPISKVFHAHGGTDTWNAMKTLEFTIGNEKGDELTTIDLKQRKSRIELPKHSIGFDGKAVWVFNKDTTNYQGNAKFYHNLMFYFCGMPFVFSDSGIHYSEAEALNFQGITYPGIKISYDDGVGASSDDEYVLYYHPETYKMEWLAYTVTYFTQEKSEKFSFVKYGEWQTVNGLLLPKTISWYHVENGAPTEKRNEVIFKDVKISKEKLDASNFIAPKGSFIIE
ncbi:hypothetical protein PK35_05785 [Tamlana nanhaiensis]|uniref:Threonine synthase n=1 Tax=Neotamlana nanhaiensis TaxID=1382798 RepID=A0A0D7W2M4_9FLAO|nr:DUF6503 family protein [Tamlana nanhaiensis]KJD33370.1 hypothetical protein PK35_05785 [Tamlana nanhaiensis]